MEIFCSKCGGSGKIIELLEYIDRGLDVKETKCSECNGNGSGGYRCVVCGAVFV